LRFAKAGKGKLDATFTAVTYKFLEQKKSEAAKPAGRPNINRRAKKK